MIVFCPFRDAIRVTVNVYDAAADSKDEYISVFLFDFGCFEHVQVSVCTQSVKRQEAFEERGNDRKAEGRVKPT